MDNVKNLFDLIAGNMNNSIKNFYDLIAGNMDNSIKLLVVAALLVAILIIYDRDDGESKVISSFTRCIRRLMALVADVTSDIISIFSSLTEILNLIRILVFGKVDSQTQIFLANYAVIFMSVVSYFTTMTGLQLVLGTWQAILASFGIQVGILVFSTRLSRLMEDKFAIDKKKRYIYRLKENTAGCDCNNGSECCRKMAAARAITIEETEKSKKLEESKALEEEPENKKRFCKPNHFTSLKDKDKKKEKRRGFWGWSGTIIILCLLIICSAFFSYNAFWEKFVFPKMPLSEYVDAQVSISEVEEEYSGSFREYQQSLEDTLHGVNNSILENLNVNNIRLLEIQMGNLESELRDIEESIQEANARMSEFEEGSAERNEIEDGELAVYVDRRDDIAEDIEEIEGQLYSSNVYLVDQALRDLSAFYANPLSKEIALEQVEDSWGDLLAGISQIEETKALLTSEQRTNLNIVFGNYLELCRYYRENETTGFKMKEWQGEGVLGITGSEEERGQQYTEATKKMLENAIESLEETPTFAVVNSIWNDKVIEQPRKAELLEKLYAAYRGIEGDSTEKAIVSLVSLIKRGADDSAVMQKNRGMVWFVLIMAAFIDLTIVFISIWKGNKNTNRSFSELRRLVGILFIKADRDRDEEARRMQLSVAFGLLSGALMFAVQQIVPNASKTLTAINYWYFFMYCACSILAAVIIGKAIGRTRNLVERKEDCDVDESISTSDNPASMDEERSVKQYLVADFEKIIDLMEVKTICEIDLETRKLKKEKSVTCIKTDQVRKWKIEFAMLQSYKIAFTTEDNAYYILRDDFWKMLYTNILNKMSGNLMLPMSVEDLVNYDDTEENNS